MHIRKATDADYDDLWEIIEPIIRAGTTYAYDRDTTKEQARSLWLSYPRQTYVAEVDGDILGTYFIATNHKGPGSHVCNCGYMVSERARGRGLATTMCEHSQREAIALGYRAMQFNFVATTNSGAVRLWQKLGFTIVGTLPGAFNHPDAGYVDAHVMFKALV